MHLHLDGRFPDRLAIAPESSNAVYERAQAECREARGMRYNSKTLPERVRRLMPKETRKELNAPTNSEIAAKQNTRREKELQENIAALLRQRGIWFERKRMDRRSTGVVGCPDFLFAAYGRAIALECKMPGFEPSEDQQRCMTQMQTPPNSWQTYVTTSEQSVVDLLNRLEGKQ